MLNIEKDKTLDLYLFRQKKKAKDHKKKRLHAHISTSYGIRKAKYKVATIFKLLIFMLLLSYGIQQCGGSSIF
tara:strand:+ start:229 stop:447 length:219 start_codon:yes stop_codon:yes gene_type:complete